MNKKTLLGIIPIVVFAALQTAISEIRMDLSIKDAVKEEIANQKLADLEHYWAVPECLSPYSHLTKFRKISNGLESFHGIRLVMA